MSSKKSNIFKAIADHDLKALNHCLEHDGTDPNIVQKPGPHVNWTALMLAANCQFADGVRALLQARADVNARTLEGNGKKGGLTALHCAITGSNSAGPQTDQAERVKIVDNLLKAGADATAAHGDVTPLWLAESAGYLEIVRLLLSAGASTRVYPQGAMPPLHGAAQGRHEDIARLLIEGGAGLNEKSAAGNTALIMAAFRGAEKIVELLVDKGAELDHQGYEGRTALISAALYGRNAVLEHEHQRALRMVQVLVKAGAALDIKNNKGETALDIALRSENQAVAQFLASQV